MKRRIRPNPPRLHIGCGRNKLSDWLNIDLDAQAKPDLRIDVTKGLPFLDESVELIHSEDFIEHLSLDQGRAFFQECHRVLKPDGTMRVLTPDLRTVVAQYVSRHERDLDFYRKSFNCITFGEMLNMAMRMGGHTFLYDRETLDMVLEECGFLVRHAHFGESEVLELGNIDIRDTGMPLYTECRKRPPNHRFVRVWEGAALADTWHPLGDLQVKRGSPLHLSADGPDPQLVSQAFFFPISDAHEIRCQMRVLCSEGEFAQLFWKTDSDFAFSERNSLVCPLLPGTSFDTYSFDIGNAYHSRPDDVIRQIRLDPMNGRGEAEIRRISIE